MDEQGKINFPVENTAGEAAEEQTAVNNGGNASEVNPPGFPNAAAQVPYAANMGMNTAYPNQMRAVPQYPTVYGNQMPAQMPAMPYQTPYAQGYPQQPAYRPAQAPAAYPQQATRSNYQSFQQNAPGTGPGQYNYKASMSQHNSGSTYSGAGPGQYDFRSGTPNTMGAKQQPAQQAPVPYGYNSFGQYPGVYNKPQSGSGYSYFPQQYPNTGYPSQFNQAMPAGQPYLAYTPQYGAGAAMYNQQRPVQPGYPAANRPNAVQPGVNAASTAAPNPAAVASLQKKTPTPEPPKEEAKKPVEQENKPETSKDGEEYREIMGPDGKMIRVKRVAIETEPEPEEKKDGPSKFIQEQIKAEMGGLREGEEPIIQYKSGQKKTKKKNENEGKYVPGLKDMIMGPPKKDKADKAADFWEWKCPQCGTINSDYTSTCQCGCTQQRAKAIARGRVINENIRENNPIPGSNTAQQQPQTGANAQQQQRPMGANAGFVQGGQRMQQGMQGGQGNWQRQQAQPITMPQPQQSAQTGAGDILTPNDMVMTQGARNQGDDTKIQKVTKPETATKIEEPVAKDDYDPEMPEKVVLTEEQQKAEIDEWMNQPIQVWRPKSQKDDDKKKKVVTEIYITPQKIAEQKAAEEKKAEEEKSEEKPAEQSGEKKAETADNTPKEEKPAAKAVEPKKEKSDKEPSEPDGLINDNEWKCSMCENINPVANDTCKCGHKRGKKQMSYEDILRMTRKKPSKANEKNDDKPAEKLKPDAKSSAQLGKAVPTGIVTQTAAKGLQDNKTKDQKPTDKDQKLKAEEEAKRKAEEEAKRKAEEEAKRKAEEEAKRKAEEEAKRKAE